MDSHRLMSEQDFYYPIGLCAVTILYGFYTALFALALWIWRARWASLRAATYSAKLYLTIMVLMWLVATAHLMLSIERLLHVFVLDATAKQPAEFRLLDATKKDNLAHLALVSVMVWLGDILILYRTYIVWDRKFKVIILPLILHWTYIAINTVAIYYLAHPDAISPEQASYWVRPVFPVLFVQNLLTTSLLAWKAVGQHRSLNADGVWRINYLYNLGLIARIFVETVMVYTIELLIVIILGSVQHPATGSISICLVPTIGIVFILLSIRVHFGATNNIESDRLDALPHWLRDMTPTDDLEMSNSRARARRRSVDNNSFLRARRERAARRHADLDVDDDLDQDSVSFPEVSSSSSNNPIATGSGTCG